MTEQATIYPTVEIEGLFENPSFGFVSKTELDFEARHPSPAAGGSRVRLVNLSAKPRGHAKALFASDSWTAFASAIETFTTPTAAVKALLNRVSGKASARRPIYLFVDDRQQLREVDAVDVAKVIEKWSTTPSEDHKGSFLVEYHPSQVNNDFEAVITHLWNSLVVRPAPAVVTASAHIGGVLITPRKAEAIESTPEQLAIARRDALLERARAERWPDSDTVGQQLGSSNATAGRTRAARLRKAGELLGVWSAADRTFYHPRFQLLETGQVHTKIPELLQALASIPTFAAGSDVNGWGRLDWLYTPRGALSERSIAEAASEDGIAPNEAALSAEARTPADVFPGAPDAVIALAHDDAEVIRGRD